MYEGLIGKQVRVVDINEEGEYDRGRYIGAIGILERTDGTELQPYRVMFDDKQDWWCKEIEPVDKEKMFQEKLKEYV